jgi:hypothetical protein
LQFGGHQARTNAVSSCGLDISDNVFEADLFGALSAAVPAAIEGLAVEADVTLGAEGGITLRN